MIGVGVITYKREKLFENCLKSILKCDFDEVVAVNDGTPYKRFDIPLIQHEENKGVCISKNDALRYLMNKGCSDIFLVEDDMEILREDVFQKYIDTGKKTGLEHLNFGFHGRLNKPNGKPNPEVKEINGEKIFINRNLVGSFSYYTRNCIEQTGYFDEKFHNAFDHVDHTYRISLLGLTTPFWAFADIYKSYDYIKEQVTTADSVIRGTEATLQLLKAQEYFKEKHGEYASNIKREK